MEPEFDGLSDEYERLLRDPIRDRFMGAASDFFHIRKRDLIREYFHRQGRDSGQLAFLDVGCGKGELLTLLKDDFVQSAGCDPSGGMLGGSFSKEIETRLQPAADKI